MTAVRLAVTELMRLLSGKLPRLAVVALLLVPSLYAGLYLYANKDPYGNMDQVPAAVVVEDKGATLANGEEVQFGDKVADELLKSRSFGWRQVTRAQAAAGVSDGTYNFALILPASFSSDLTSSTRYKPVQAEMEIETNDANNYLSRTIANQLTAQVTKSVASQVSETAASQMLEGFSTIHANIKKAADGAAKLADGATKANAGSHELATGAATLSDGTQQLAAGSAQLAAGAQTASSGAQRLSSGASQLSAGLSEMNSKTAQLPAQTRALADGARQVADGNRQVAAAGKQAATASGNVITRINETNANVVRRLQAAGATPEQIAIVESEMTRLATPVTTANSQVQTASGQLNQLSTGADQVAAGAGKLADASSTLQSGIASAATGAQSLSSGASDLAAGNAKLATGAQTLTTNQQKAADGAKKLADGSATLDRSMDQLESGAKELSKGLADGVKQIPNPDKKTREAVAQTLGNPVGVKGVSLASAADYGAGLAPFFLSLATWIGAYVLFLVISPLSPRALAAGQPAWRTSLGGWLAPAILGVVQVVAALGVTLLLVGVSATHPLRLVLFLAAVSACFVMILHALASRLGAVGKFLGLVLMVVQLVSAGGTFPWQTLPTPLHPLHHALPMTYAVDGVRRLMYGGSLGHIWVDLLVLAGYVLAAYALSTFAAKRAGVWTAARVKPELSI
ncbi:MAG: YhgE/Pip domain-containing protein [Micrococcales bacterium]|nr:YhgE/Pip domain-containing protein [Micrococcales bacterium]